MRVLSAMIVLSAAVLLSPTSHGGQCAPGWDHAFEPTGMNVNGWVFALTEFDDGSGPALYAAGRFVEVAGQPAGAVARWDGTSWTPLGLGVADFPDVVALTVFDDGDGEALYAGGTFTLAGGQPANFLAKWDGESWSALSSELNGPVFAMVVFDDGDGEALYVGGSFTSAGGQAANRIARWDGDSWTPLGSGMSGQLPWVYALAVFNDGTGDALYAGGEFTHAGGQQVNYIAKWDGESWSPLGSGVASGEVSTYVFTLAVYHDGAGEALYAGGNFTFAGGLSAIGVARWNGTSWSSLGAGVGGSESRHVFALSVFNDGGGEALYVGGAFVSAGGQPASSIARWNGFAWTPLGAGVVGAVWEFAAFDDGDGMALFVGGSFRSADGQPAQHVARWMGCCAPSWEQEIGQPGTDGNVVAQTVFDDGDGMALYAGGNFTSAGGVAANRVAKWDGAAWAPVGAGMNDWVRALAVFDDGDGEALYAGGDFTVPTGASRIAMWDGDAWTPLGFGMNNPVFALAVFDDGDGEALYAGGSFTSAGLQSASGIARWDGDSWTPVGSGMGGLTPWVHALTVFNDGTGDALYAAGRFTQAGGDPANHIAKWDGDSWSPLDGGMNFPVFALAVFDDGDGEALYALGSFTSAGGEPANRIARWDGVSWAPLGSGLNGIAYAMRVFDDGYGEALYAGGAFSTAGGHPASGIARWDGASWARLGLGNNAAVESLEVFDDGDGPALHVGGFFIAAGGEPANNIAIYRSCPRAVCPGDANGDGIVDFADLNIVLSQFGQTGPGLAGDLNGDEVVDFADLSIVISGIGLDCL